MKGRPHKSGDERANRDAHGLKHALMKSRPHKSGDRELTWTSATVPR
jgi:hypothetical protein